MSQDVQIPMQRFAATLCALACLAVATLLTLAGTSEAVAGDLIKIPLRWCAIDGSPAVTNPGGAGQPDTNTVLWRRHERASEHFWIPGAEITFRSGIIKEIKEASSFPIIADPCPPTNEPLCQGGNADGLSCTPNGMGEDPATCGAGMSCATQACPCSFCTGQLGDVMDPAIDGAEIDLAEDGCRDAWDGLEDEFSVSLAGPIAVNIRQFVNEFGLETPLRGRAAGPGLTADAAEPEDICNIPPPDILSANGPGVAVMADNQTYSDPDELVFAHELGHVLWLRHGNGLDDDMDMRYDPNGLGLGFNCDPDEDGINDPPTLMHPNGLTATMLITEPQRLTAREVADVLPGAKQDPPGVDLDLEVVGDDRRDPVDDGVLIEMSGAAIMVNEVDEATVFSHGIPERVPISSDTQFLFFADLDNNTATGGSPNSISGLLPAPTCFVGAELVTRILLPFGIPPAFASVWRWDQGLGLFVPLVDPGISAEVITTVPWEADVTNTFETMALRIPNDLRGPIAERVPAQAIAQLANAGEGDQLANELIGECSVPFRFVRPQYPLCLVTPDPLDPGNTATVEAAGLFENQTVEVLIGDLLVAEGHSDGKGGAIVDFVIPIDTSPGSHLVTVGIEGTALTADCVVEVRSGDPDRVRELLVGVVFDTGEFVSIDRNSGQGTRLGKADPRHGLTHRGVRLFGIDDGVKLFELDPTSGATINTVIPQYGTGIEGAIAYRRDGVAFTIRGGAAMELWRFGAIDGGAVLVTNDLGVHFDGLAFAPDDRLYGLSDTGVLYRIDTEAGFVEFVGSTGVRNNTTAGIAFSSEGRLYAAISDTLYTLNTNTGNATSIGPIGFGSPDPDKGFAGLASILVAMDSDGDGVNDSQDNCLLVANAEQRDTNNDGFGNPCDADLNNDCRVNFLDLSIVAAVFFTADADADLDGDGLVNFADLSIVSAGFFAAPGPSGVPNICD